ncbi:DUF1015 domain-containing protein [bacterium]|nr:DUF1015 domain-containing protein [bacterium]
MTKEKVKPFTGIFYNPEKIKDLSKVVTPPYDVISADYQNALYARDPYNFVQIDYSREPDNIKYVLAGDLYHKWLAENVLLKDDKPSYYFHHHTFTLPNGQTVVRKGFFGLRRVEDFSEGGIKPHEKTLDGPKADRLMLMRSTKSNLSPIFSLYSDPEKNIDSLVAKLKLKPPVFDFKTEDGYRHQLWRESDPTVCKFISDKIAGQAVFIADGHHRYETAINYRNECRRQHPPGDGNEAFNYVMMYFSNMNDEGLVILPIHRALHSLRNFSVESFVEKLSSQMKVLPLGEKSDQELLQILADAGKEDHAYAMITPDKKQSFLVSIKRRVWKTSPVAINISPSLLDLDVTVLHRLVFEEILRMSPESQANQENLIYWKETEKAIKETRNGACQLTFLLNPTKIEDMEKVALAGEKMPQKSTFFYPKIVSGLMINPLE